jgi:transcriptional regulator with XRE-family HTH domain
MTKKQTKIAARIIELRTMAGLNLTAVSALVGSDVASWSRWENDVRIPSRETIVKIAHVFDVSTDWLISGKGPGPSEKRVKAAIQKIAVVTR